MHEHDLTTHQSPLELLLLPKQEKGKDLKMQATEAALTAAAASVEVFSRFPLEKVHSCLTVRFILV